MNAEGRCVCPEGTTFRNGQCSPAGDKPTPSSAPCCPARSGLRDGRCVCPEGTLPGANGCYTPPPPARQCTLLPGMVRTEGGKCICPKGTELQNGACRKVEQPPVRQCKLLPGMIRTESGKCICPKGTELKNGACRKVEQPPVRHCKLLPGQIRTENGRCICPRGTSWSRPMPQDDSRVSARHAAEERQVCPGGHRRSKGLPCRHGRQISELPQARTVRPGLTSSRTGSIRVRPCGASTSRPIRR